MIVQQDQIEFRKNYRNIFSQKTIKIFFYNKYALKNTKIWITISKFKWKIVLTCKNMKLVSQFQINHAPK
jgi:hypothetical protein